MCSQTPSLHRPLAFPRTLMHGAPSRSPKHALSAAMRGSRRLLRNEEREAPWHTMAMSEEKTTFTEMLKEALSFASETLSARQGGSWLVEPCAVCG